LASYADFKRIFQQSEEDLESRGLHAEAGGSFESIPPKVIPELNDQTKVSLTKHGHTAITCIVDVQVGSIQDEPVTNELLANFKVKVAATVCFYGCHDVSHNVAGQEGARICANLE
jgi:hypothetical protein